jgi:hypothetical protein
MKEDIVYYGILQPSTELLSPLKKAFSINRDLSCGIVIFGKK